MRRQRVKDTKGDSIWCNTNEFVIVLLDDPTTRYRIGKLGKNIFQSQRYSINIGVLCTFIPFNQNFTSSIVPASILCKANVLQSSDGVFTLTSPSPILVDQIIQDMDTKMKVDDTTAVSFIPQIPPLESSPDFYDTFRDIDILDEDPICICRRMMDAAMKKIIVGDGDSFRHDLLDLAKTHEANLGSWLFASSLPTVTKTILDLAVENENATLIQSIVSIGSSRMKNSTTTIKQQSVPRATSFYLATLGGNPNVLRTSNSSPLYMDYEKGRYKVFSFEEALDDAVNFALRQHSTTLKVWRALNSQSITTSSTVENQIAEALRYGNLTVATYLVKSYVASYPRKLPFYTVLTSNATVSSELLLPAPTSFLCKKMSALHIAAAAEGHEMLSMLILDPEYLTLLSSVDQDGYLPLHYAAANANPANLHLLLQAHSMAGKTELYHASTTNDGYTPLMIAAQTGIADNVSLLIEAFKMTSEEFYNVVIKSQIDFTKRWNVSHYAAYCGSVDVLEVLVAATVNNKLSDTQSENISLLSLSIQQCHNDVFDYLRAGYEDRRSFVAPLFYATISGNVGALQKCIERVGDIRNVCDHFGNNLMHYAAAYGFSKILIVLFQEAEGGPSLVRSRNHNGLRPIDVAADKQHCFCKEILSSMEESS